MFFEIARGVSFLGWMKCDQRIRLSLLQEAGSLMRIWAFWWLNFDWNSDALLLRVVISPFGISRSISEAPNSMSRSVLFCLCQVNSLFFGKVKVAWAIIIGFMTSAHARYAYGSMSSMIIGNCWLSKWAHTRAGRRLYATSCCAAIIEGKLWACVAFLMSLSKIHSHRACAKSSQQIVTMSGSVTQSPTLLQISSAYLYVD